MKNKKLIALVLVIVFVLSNTMNTLAIGYDTFGFRGVEKPENLALNRTYSASSDYNQGGLHLKADYAFDGDTVGENYHRWASGKSNDEWIQIDFGESVSYNTIKIMEPPTDDLLRIKSVIIQKSDTGLDGSWTSLEPIQFDRITPIKECVLSEVQTSKFLRIGFSGDNRGYNVNEIEIYNLSEPPVVTPNENLALDRIYLASSEYKAGGLHLKADYAFDGDLVGANYHRWASDLGADQWLQIDFGEAVAYNTIQIMEPATDDLLRIRSLKVQKSDTGLDGSWSDVQTFNFDRTTPVKEALLSIARTSQFLRMNFDGDPRGYNINEIQVYNIPQEPNLVMVEDFEGYADGQQIPGIKPGETQTQNVEITGAISGQKSLKLYNNTDSSSGALGLESCIDKPFGTNNVVVKAKRNNTQGGQFAITANDHVNFSTTELQGYDIPSDGLMTISYDAVSGGFDIPKDFDGYLFFENTQKVDIQKLNIGMIENTFSANADHTLWIDDLATYTEAQPSDLVYLLTGASLHLQTSNITKSSVDLKWNTVPLTQGYNVYNGDTKVNDQPIKQTSYKVENLTANTKYSFCIKAVNKDGEFCESNIATANTNKIVGDMLESAGDGSTLTRPVSDLALNLEYKGPALSDDDWYNWCIAPIEDEEGKTHIFSARWEAKHGMGGWITSGELIHSIGDSPEGPFTYVETIFTKDTLPPGQYSPHNIHIKKIDDKYCLTYIVQTKVNDVTGQKIALALSDSLDGPWDLVGEDGIIVEPDTTGWTANSRIGTDNHDIMKIRDKYYIYFKAGPDTGNTHYGYAVADSLEGPYIKSEAPMTDNVNYIEDGTCFEWNGKYYLLTTDNFGSNTNKSGIGYGILWESETGTDYKLSDAKIGFGLLQDYITIPDHATYPYGSSGKFERPAILFRDGQPAYFYATNGTNVEGKGTTQSFVFKINGFEPEPPAPTDTNKKVLDFTIKYADSKMDEVATLVPSAKTKFMAAYNNAVTVKNNGSATQTEVDQAWAMLMDAIHMLSFQAGDKTALITLITACEGLDLDNFKDTAAFQAALLAAIAVRDDIDALAVDIQSVYDRLNTALKALVLKDKSSLTSIIKFTDNIKQELLIDNDAKAAVFGVDGLLATAKAVLGNAKSTQEQIDAAFENLVDAIVELRYIADRDTLEKVLNDAKDVDENLYTAESYAAFNAAVAEGERILADPNATKEQYALSIADIQDKQKALIKTKVPPTEGGSTGTDVPEDATDQPINNTVSIKQEVTADGANGTTNSATTGENAVTTLTIVMLLAGAVVVVFTRKRTNK